MVRTEEVPTTKRDNNLARGAGENDALKGKGYFERRPHLFGGRCCFASMSALPRKRTRAVQTPMSAMGQKQTLDRRAQKQKWDINAGGLRPDSQLFISCSNRSKYPEMSLQMAKADYQHSADNRNHSLRSAGACSKACLPMHRCDDDIQGGVVLPSEAFRDV